MVAVGLAALGLANWYLPGFNEFLFAPSSASAGDGQIVGAIFLVGAAIVWFLPQR
jgi:hypothetical protein